MQKAAGYLAGEHDFKSFCGSGAQVKTTIREITDISVTKAEDLLTIRVTGTGFLYHMVRIIAGTLMEVGKGALSPESIPAILEKRDRQAAGPTAPACGLTLIGMEFENR